MGNVQALRDLNRDVERLFDSPAWRDAGDPLLPQVARLARDHADLPGVPELVRLSRRIAEREQREAKLGAIVRPLARGGGSEDTIQDAFRAASKAGWSGTITQFVAAVQASDSYTGDLAQTCAALLGSAAALRAFCDGGSGSNGSGTYGPSVYDSGVNAETARSLRNSMATGPTTHQEYQRLGRGARRAPQESLGTAWDRLLNEKEAARAKAYGIPSRRDDPLPPETYRNAASEREFSTLTDTGQLYPSPSPTNGLLLDSYNAAARAGYAGSAAQWGDVLSAYSERLEFTSWASAARLTLQGAYGLDLVMQSAARYQVASVNTQPAMEQLRRGSNVASRESIGERMNRDLAARNDARIARYGGGGGPAFHAFTDPAVAGR